MVKIYGIKNCDTMKKAFKWLEDNKINYDFFDFKKVEISDSQAKLWCKEIPLYLLINKRGTTWRKLDEQTKTNLTTESAVPLIQENPSIIKRPLLEIDGNFYVGFKADEYARIFTS